MWVLGFAPLLAFYLCLGQIAGASERLCRGASVGPLPSLSCSLCSRASGDACLLAVLQLFGNRAQLLPLLAGNQREAS